MTIGPSFLMVQAGGRRVGLPVEAVIEVREPEALETIPTVEPALRGVASLRGQLLPVLHLGTLLGGNDDEAGAMVIANLGGRTVGLEVEEAEIVAQAESLLRADETLPWARAIAVLPDQVYVPLLDLSVLVARLSEAGR